MFAADQPAEVSLEVDDLRRFGLRPPDLQSSFVVLTLTADVRKEVVGRSLASLHLSIQAEVHGATPFESMEGQERVNGSQHCFACRSTSRRLWPILADLFEGAKGSIGKVLREHAQAIEIEVVPVDAASVEPSEQQGEMAGIRPDRVG